MPNKKLNTTLLWKQIEDVVVPTLRLSLTDRVVYSHLLRHSHLEGRTRLHFSISQVARGAGLSPQPTRRAVRRLVSYGALRLLQRTRAGHIVEVRLPDEIPALSSRLPANAALPHPAITQPALPLPTLEDLDFSQDKSLRAALYARERGFCFYCMRRLSAAVRCLDHVVPQAQSGRNSYRNLVSCCIDCNSAKRDRPAADFLRSLYRDRRLNITELNARLHALDDLAAGKLRPTLPQHGSARPTRNSPGRAPHHNATPRRRRPESRDLSSPLPMPL